MDLFRKSGDDKTTSPFEVWRRYPRVSFIFIFSAPSYSSIPSFSQHANTACLCTCLHILQQTTIHKISSYSYAVWCNTIVRCCVAEMSCLNILRAYFRSQETNGGYLQHRRMFPSQPVFSRSKTSPSNPVIHRISSTRTTTTREIELEADSLKHRAWAPTTYTQAGSALGRPRLT